MTSDFHLLKYILRFFLPVGLKGNRFHYWTDFFQGLNQIEVSLAAAFDSFKGPSGSIALSSCVAPSQVCIFEAPFEGKIWKVFRQKEAQ